MTDTDHTPDDVLAGEIAQALAGPAAGIPVLVGGDTDAAIRRAVRIADGYFPGEGDHARLDALLEEIKDIVDEFAGTAPQVDWGVNVVYNFTYAYVHMAMKSIFDPEIPVNIVDLGLVYKCAVEALEDLSTRTSAAAAEPARDREAQVRRVVAQAGQAGALVVFTLVDKRLAHALRLFHHDADDFGLR